jgi:DNA-binding NarL/FixJ family response regulator
MKIKVWIADDHKLFRQGLIALLSSQADIDFCGEAENGSELLFLLGESQPDLILMDLEMPEVDGLTATREVKRQFPDIKVLGLSMHKDEEYVLQMMESGANGYLLKEAEPDEVLLAIRSAHNNGFYFNDRTSTALLGRLVNEKKVKSNFSPVDELTDRELQVLQLICEQLTNQEIADRLFLSPRTIEDYRARLLQKTDARNTAGLVIFAIREGVWEV